ncbi:unnamed protein product [Trichobilharzia regenti]|nr:unnamed protein product [Trichobilharzia regenti]
MNFTSNFPKTIEHGYCLPKGVMIEHGQMVDAVLSVIETVDGKSVVILEGAKMGFLTNTIEGLMADCADLKPTMLGAVPRVLTRIYSKYQKALSGSALKTRLYDHVLKRKLAEQKQGKFNHRSLLDTLCFKKLRQALGGQVCGIVTGGAPLLPEIMSFMRVVFNGIGIESYGCTETTGVATISVVGEYRTGILGCIAYGVEVKLIDVPDLGLVAQRDNRGEVRLLNRSNQSTPLIPIP